MNTCEQIASTLSNTMKRPQPTAPRPAAGAGCSTSKTNCKPGPTAGGNGGRASSTCFPAVLSPPLSPAAAPAVGGAGGGAAAGRWPVRLPGAWRWPWALPPPAE